MRLEGYAAKFNSPAVIAGAFIETIAPGAFRESLKTADVRALWNHDNGAVLGRKSAGTLTLREDPVGLYYSVELNPDDPIAVGVGARVARRDITGSSFRFELDPEDDEWQPPARAGGLPRRTLRRLRLVEVSPVTFPAYEAASVSAVRGDDRGVVHRDRLRIRIQIEKART